MVIKVGMIGCNEGNGHPFSFSAIINGYESKALLSSGWKVIDDYLKERDPSEFGFNNIKVTHAWTQCPEMTETLCQACLIPHAIKDLTDMLDQVDAIIIARDDFENHKKFAMPFLENGIPVFIDKPLSLDENELLYFKPFLQSGKLMSCSAMRYAKEIDKLRNTLSEYGDIPLIKCIGPLSWEKYGIHLLESILPLLPSEPKSILSLNGQHDSMVITMENDTLIQINTMSDLKFSIFSPVPFQLELWGTQKNTNIILNDNFSMFRRMLWHFFHSIDTGKPSIPYHSTLSLMQLLIAGRISKQNNRKVMINEIRI
ncbi:Gfo/Idh/MocA family oxidoreductase [Metabacillus rhizolycopersici]|uniref:Gfo/Idh/MocA family oxidoreductase n=1 Tax=Metabacillus rhizolycopersici TaxID=2875709 RepID=A0ABS7UVM0_9BACI|nr:Gfo/Idh/MocA family oxidoreductase [Metabacillus rhizolycopersici]MBZ5751974.1 Gfo/Idh/MocA family oxidoreductase [Metabacillus rhizolycopersici]